MDTNFGALGAAYESQKTFDRDRPFQDPIESWLRSAMRNTPERFRPEALRFTPGLVVGAGTTVNNASVALTQAQTITIPNDQFFVLKKLRGWFQGGLSFVGTSGGGLAPWTAMSQPVGPNRAEIAQIEFNVRQEGTTRDVFTTPIPLVACTGLAGQDQDELDFADSHYTFVPGDTVRVTFSLNTGSFPLALTNFSDGVAAPNTRFGQLAFGVVLVGVAAHRSLYERFMNEDLQRRKAVAQAVTK